ncbi:hypothetical protein BDA99DRAFT_581667 [Phascolomyces articulosus]|uniref:Uncharacterized protein n=1 Tax=Phascolomyces articulosus TaxID=60185 RepID=A0AAD5PD05_9FUNG|nr:hypothetical protein BDA99DRAFT_581667 [Phascolomyces articulosus]
MSVQAAVALLNRNASTSSTTKPVVPSWKSNATTATTVNNNDKAAELKKFRTRTPSGGVASILSKFDQQQPPSTTSTSTTSNSNNSSVANISNKKTNNNNNLVTAPMTVTTSSSSSSSISTTVPITNESIGILSTIGTSATAAPSESTTSSTISTPKSSIKVRQRKSSSVSAAAVTRRSRSASVRDRAATINRNIVADTLAQELAALYQDTLNKLQAAEEEIEKLHQQCQQENNNNHSNTATKKQHDDQVDNKMASQLRDYEIRIQYLSEKLDQLSQEHSMLERQLDQEQRRTKRITLDTPISPEFRPFSKLFDTTNTTTTATGSTTTDDIIDRRRITVDTNLTSENDEFWNCLLDVYEKGSSVNTSITTEEDQEEDNDSSNTNKAVISTTPAIATSTLPPIDNKEQQLVVAELLFVKKQLTAVEKGAQMMLERHIRDLEKERQQTRTLTEVVHKQDQLIASLESKLCSDEYSSKKDNNNSHLLLQEQVELQRIELEDKRGLLTRLLDEREELLRQVMNNNCNKPLPSGVRSRSASVRSSIDVLSEMSKESRHPLSRASSSSLRQQHNQQQLQQQSSPRSSMGSQATSTLLGRSTPPPTAPPKDPLPPLPPRSSSSMHSILSPATSWSSADYAAATGRYSNNHHIKSNHSGDIVSSTVYRESFNNGTTMESPLPPHPSTFLHHYPPQHQQPIWLDYQSMDPQQQQQQQQQQKQQSPQPQTSYTINRQPTVKLRKANSNGNSAFWKGWRHRLGSR